MSKLQARMPRFLTRGYTGAFLSVVLAGQITYSAFEAFKGSLMLPLCDVLGIGVDEFGALMGWLGIAMFLYVPAGWVNNRFTIRSILVAWSAWRLVTYLVLYLWPGLSFQAMVVIAITWGVWDAIGWPAVVNGVAFIARDEDSEGRGLAMGLLETIRRGLEFLMNLVIVGLLAAFPEHATGIMRGFAIGYALLLIPLIFALLRYVPSNAIGNEDTPNADAAADATANADAAPSPSQPSANKAALLGLIHVLFKPKVWLAGIAALCIYWCYVNLIYSSAPYLTLVYDASPGMSSAFGVFNTGFIGIIAGLVAGLTADYVFKSSTKMIAAALAVTAAGVGLVSLLPADDSMMWPAMILLMIMAIGVFMGKAVILAPIAELHLPESINGSAMAVGSFLAYASIFWANPMTAGIIEAHQDNAYVGYQIIFMITLVVALVGMLAAGGLLWLQRRERAEAPAA